MLLPPQIVKKEGFFYVIPTTFRKNLGKRNKASDVYTNVVTLVENNPKEAILL